jgi:hypothetical protein
MADLWALSPLVVRAAPVICGSKPFAFVHTPRMISGTVYERLSLGLFDGISIVVLGINCIFLPFHCLL